MAAVGIGERIGEAGRAPLDKPLQDTKRMSRVYKLRPPLLYSLSGFEIAVMLMGLGIGLRRVFPRLGDERGRAAGDSKASSLDRREAWVRGLLCTVLLVPPVLLLLGRMPDAGAGAMVAVLLLLLAVGFLLAALLSGRRLAMLRWLAGIGLGTTLADFGRWADGGERHEVFGARL
ncbi:hypothetical protein LJK88_03370 [Paenibacillus sp. P26]|nr:hypothetical protein LJK88_03370 [Paenibacillus sp. P26]